MVTVLRKKKYERMLYSRPTVFLLIVLTIILSRAVISVYEKAQSTQENLEIAQVELDKLVDRGELLEDNLSSLATPKGVEAEIRDKFNVVKEGESVIMIIEPEEMEGGRKNKNTKSLWERIKSMF